MPGDLHRISIGSGFAGLGTETQIDDTPLTGIRGITLRFGVDEPNTMEVEMLGQSFAVNAGAEVEYAVVVLDPITSEIFSGVGATPVDAVRMVLSKMENN